MVRAGPPSRMGGGPFGFFPALRTPRSPMTYARAETIPSTLDRITPSSNRASNRCHHYSVRFRVARSPSQCPGTWRPRPRPGGRRGRPAPGSAAPAADGAHPCGRCVRCAAGSTPWPGWTPAGRTPTGRSPRETPGKTRRRRTRPATGPRSTPGTTRRAAAGTPPPATAASAPPRTAWAAPARHRRSCAAAARYRPGRRAGDLARDHRRIPPEPQTDLVVFQGLGEAAGDLLAISQHQHLAHGASCPTDLARSNATTG